ncbi:hypothetical protein EXS62_02770 [Candidatus Kaiserbacteria bacterium]|nr:hypothetical protein [Candidatus Kaiserbacteria bacterium]
MARFSKEDLVLPAILLMVGLSAFGLGRLSATGEQGGSTAGSPAAQTASAAAPTTSAYVASKSGAKYYLPTCSAVARITEENKVWFESVEEAEAAGYEPAANCPGL